MLSKLELPAKPGFAGAKGDWNMFEARKGRLYR